MRPSLASGTLDDALDAGHGRRRVAAIGTAADRRVATTTIGSSWGTVRLPRDHGGAESGEDVGDEQPDGA